MNTQMKRDAALKRGADDLQNHLEWVLRNRSRALENAQREYSDFCVRLYRKIEAGVRRRQAP